MGKAGVITTAVVAVPLLFAGLGAGQVTDKSRLPDGYKEAKWGMSVNQVMDLYGDMELFFKGGDALAKTGCSACYDYLLNYKNISFKTNGPAYERVFSEGPIEKIMYIFTEDTLDGQVKLYQVLIVFKTLDFKALKNKTVKEYGPPSDSFRRDLGITSLGMSKVRQYEDVYHWADDRTVVELGYFQRDWMKFITLRSISRKVVKEINTVRAKREKGGKLEIEKKRREERNEIDKLELR